MADNPLAPIAGNQQHRRPHHNSNGSIKSFKSFATAETHPDDTTFARDPTAPSSPFLYEAERSSRSPAKSTASPSKSRGKSQSPAKIPLNDDKGRVPLTEDTLRANEMSLGTPRAVHIKQVATATAMMASSRNHSPSESAFSAFSAIPNADMTTLAKLGLSPGKTPGKQSQDAQSPTRSRPNTPGTARPARNINFDDLDTPMGEDGTTQLIDFTEQLNMVTQSNRSPNRHRTSPSKDTRDQQYKQRDAAGFRPASPSKIRELTNLLDFDLPPAPTPRSLPSVTPRELESLKAGLMSQISSLKATLQGKEAEISALKVSSTDAENRVADAQEQLVEARSEKASLEQEKIEWETRDRETQRVLQEVRNQIESTDRERAQLEDRLAEAERRAEDAELRAQEADSKIAGAAAGAQAVDDSAADAGLPGSPANKAVQVAVEKVARELHTLYKAKHENKVGQLKKSYEMRWSKKTDALKADVDRLEREVQESRMEVEGLHHELQEAKLSDGRVEAMTTINPSKLAELQAKDKEIQELNKDLLKLKDEVEKARSEKSHVEQRADDLADGAVADSNHTKELKNKTDRLTSEVDVLRSKTKKLAKELELSREENSALVATVDEFLSMDLEGATAAIVASTVPIPDSAPSSAHPSNASRPGSSLSGSQYEGGHPVAHTPGASKPSGLKGPGFGFGQSRIGLGPPPGMKRSVSGSRSGIMSNIERMGRVKGATNPNP